MPDSRFGVRAHVDQLHNRSPRSQTRHRTEVPRRRRCGVDCQPRGLHGPDPVVGDDRSRSRNGADRAVCGGGVVDCFPPRDRRLRGATAPGVAGGPVTPASVEYRLRGIADGLWSWLGRSIADMKNVDSRARIGRMLLYVLAALLSIHAGLVAIGVPTWWKEVVLAGALLVAVTLPARARFERVDYLVVIYFLFVAASAAAHRVTNPA